MPYSDFEAALRAARRPGRFARAGLVMAAIAGSGLAITLALTEYSVANARVVSSIQIPGKSANERLVVFDLDGRLLRQRFNDRLAPSAPGSQVCVRVARTPIAGWRWYSILHPGFCAGIRNPAP